MQKKFQWAQAEVVIGSKAFIIIHSLTDDEGTINTLNAALQNWIFRTNEYSAASFVDYINSKGEVRAYTVQQWKDKCKKN